VQSCLIRQHQRQNLDLDAVSSLVSPLVPPQRSVSKSDRYALGGQATSLTASRPGRLKSRNKLLFMIIVRISQWHARIYC